MNKQQLLPLGKEQQIHFLFDKITENISQANVKNSQQEGLLSTVKSILIGILNYRLTTRIKDAILITAKETEKKHNSNHLQWPSLVNFDRLISLGGDHETILLTDDSAKKLAQIIYDMCVEQENKFNVTALIEKIQKVKPYEIDENELKYYIPVNGCHNNTANAIIDLEQETNQFLNSNKKVLLLLGNSGAGKSTFCQYISLRLQQKNITDSPLILYIMLGAYEDPRYDLIATHLKRYGLSDEEIRQLKNYPKIIICDGYDEIDKEAYQNLYATNDFEQWGVKKLIISCRSSYLFHSADYKQFFYPILNKKLDRNGLTEITVLPFNSDQIKSYIDKFLANIPPELMIDDEWLSTQKYLDQIKVIPGLTELIDNPFFLRILMEVLPFIVSRYESLSPEEQIPLTKMELYEQFIANYFNRQIDKLTVLNKLSSTLREDFQLYAQNLASAMTEKGITYVAYKPQSTLARTSVNKNTWQEFFGETNPIMVTAREGCPLKRLLNNPNESETRFAFIHYSIQEFFYAKDLLEKTLELESTIHTQLKKKPQKQSNPYTFYQPESGSQPLDIKKLSEEEQLAYALQLSMLKK